jgi:hypothetical protein
MAGVTLYGIVNPGANADSEVSLLMGLTYPLTVQSDVPYLFPSNNNYSIRYVSSSPNVVSVYLTNTKYFDFTLTGNQYICTFDVFNRDNCLNKLFFGDASYQLPAIVRAAYFQATPTSYRVALEINKPYNSTNTIRDIIVGGVYSTALLYTQARLENGNTVYRSNLIAGIASPTSVSYRMGTYTSAPVTSVSFGPTFSTTFVGNDINSSNGYVTTTFSSPTGTTNLKSVILTQGTTVIGTFPVFQSGSFGYVGRVGSSNYSFTRPPIIGLFSIIFVSVNDSVHTTINSASYLPVSPIVTISSISSSSIQVTLTPGNTQGFPVTSFTLVVDVNNGSSETITVAGNGTNPVSYTYTNVTLGLGYRFRAMTNTQAGTSAPSALQSFTILQVAPAQPTDVTVVGGDAQAVVSFTAPVDNGGNAITEYKVYNAANNTLLSYGPSSPITIVGLTNGTSYSVYVRAVNAVGEGIQSDSSTLFTPQSPSAAPCFFGNAPVLTPSGYKRMDSIKVGDVVLSDKGEEVQVKHVELTLCAANKQNNPFIIEKGEYGATERLLISPAHRVSVGGKMVKAKDLGLEREEMEGVLHYYNLQLDNWSNMVVAGVKVESLAPIQHTVVTVEELVSILQAKYGSNVTTKEITNKVLRTCRLLKDGRVEVPILRTKA